MNLFANVASQKRSQRTIGVMLCLALSLLTPALVGQPVTSSNRFLFIIDISAAMKPLEKQLRETVFDLIYSGARGRMQNGDTYGLWLVNDHNDTSFQMETWKAKHIVELAAQATSHAKTNGFTGKARLDVALADALRVIKKVDDLIVIVVSNGETPLAGTPFDQELNARIGAIAPGMKLAKAAVNTALVAQDGEFVAWAVNSPDFLIDVPKVAPKPKAIKPAMVAQTNLPEPQAKAVAATTTSNASVVVKPRVAAGAIIITKESVAKEKLSYLSSTTNFAEPPPVVAATNSIATVVARPPTNLSAVMVTNQTNPVVATAALEIPASPASGLAAPTVAAVDEADSIFINPNPNRNQTLDASEKTGSLSAALRWAGAGAGFMLLCVVILRIIVRRGRDEPSLISRALARERLLH